MTQENIQNENAIDLINNLKKLRYKDLNDASLMQEYLDNIYYLLKAKALLLMEFKNNNYDILNSINIVQDDFNKLESIPTTLANNALKQNFAYEQIRFKINNISQAIAVAFKLETNSDENKVIFFLYEYINKDDLNNLILKTQLINDIPTPSNNNITVTSPQVSEDLQYILNLSTEMLSIKKFKLCCNTLTNDLATKFDFDKVSLGFYDNTKLNISSISHTSDFEKNNTLYENTISLYEESIYQDEDVVMVDERESNFIIDEHKTFYVQNKIKTLITFPIRYEDKIIGVIQSYSKSKVMKENEVIFFRLTVNKITPILNNIYESDISIFKYFSLKVKDLFSSFLIPENTILKSVVVFTSILLLYIIFFSWRYEVNATAVLSTENAAIISSPFNGTINNIFVKVGDNIAKDQELFSLETEELKLKELESKSDIVRYQKEQEKFMSERKLADMAISQAKVQQAKSKLHRIEYNLKNSIIKSSISGTIVKGDKEKLLGMSINQGDTIFQVSNSTNLFLEIKVAEDDIYHIQVGQVGRIILLSDPLNAYSFEISKIIPKAQVDSSEGNVYLVYGTLKDKTEKWWHPGMSGVVKIDTGSKNIFWIIFHDLFDFLRLYFW